MRFLRSFWAFRKYLISPSHNHSRNFITLKSSLIGRQITEADVLRELEMDNEFAN